MENENEDNGLEAESEAKQGRICKVNEEIGVQKSADVGYNKHEMDCPTDAHAHRKPRLEKKKIIRPNPT